jgi:transposase InsO family protein
MPKLSWDEAHRRLRHISLTSMRALTHIVTGLEIDESMDPVLNCESCIQAKAAHQSFPKESTTQAERPGDLTHSDLWGPSRTTSPSGSKYFILFMDDHTWRITIKFLHQKSEAEREVKNYIAWIKTQLGRMPKAFRMDNGGEFISIKPYLESKGIEFQTSAPHSPAQNGVAERLNRTLTELMIAMLSEKNLPQTLWAKAIHHATYIRNRCTTKALLGTTPMEAWTRNKPDLSHLREFGSDIWTLIEGDRTKTSPKSTKMTFVRFEERPKAIRYYNP